MRRKKEKSTFLPAVGVAGLGSATLGLQGIDSLLSKADLDRNLRITDDTLDAVKNYVNLRPDHIATREAFFPEYVERAQKATGSKIFGNKSDLTVAEAINDSVITRVPKKIQETKSFLDALPGGATLKKIIGGFSYSSIGAFKNTAEEIQKINNELTSLNQLKRTETDPKKLDTILKSITSLEDKRKNLRVTNALASHYLGTSTSYQDAYLRLMDETAGLMLDGTAHPIFKTTRSKTSQLAKDLYEAVKNYDKPTRDGYRGVKSFVDASDYLDNLWGNTAREGALQALPGAYRNPARIAEQIIMKSKDEKEALNKLIEQLGLPTASGINGEKSLYTTLKNRYGSAAKYGPVQAEMGERLGITQAAKKGLNNITSKSDALRAGADDLAAAIFHGDASRLFAGAMTGHSGDFKRAKMFNRLQRIRDPRLRILLGAGAVGSAGLLTKNILHNRRYRNSWRYKLDKFLDKIRS